jgi:CDP-6-deoxy-D-xylo-4-hexulose-3-dehydrase
MKVLPLTEQTYGSDEILSMINVLVSNKLTMGSKVKEFEEKFAKYVGSKYAIMVNSGSSANLLAVNILTNLKYSKKIVPGDKIIVPTVCWSTSVWPIIQMGLEPVFVDININTLNADIDKIETLLENDTKIKGLMLVHILGNSTNMNKVMMLKEKYNLLIIEDTCESLGSKYNNKCLGTFGECGTFSFYYSHHITTIEGGMIVTDNEEIYEILKCIRAHGWSRGQKNQTNNEIDNRFCFINIGYNLRPMETQGAMGIVQLTKLSEHNLNRKYNYNRFLNLLNEKAIEKQLETLLTSFSAEDNCDCAWFALPFLLNKTYNRLEYLTKLENCGIETRPVITGNFTRQPIFKSLKYDCNPESFENAEIIDKWGFFIGLPCSKMTDDKIYSIIDILLDV